MTLFEASFLIAAIAAAGIAAGLIVWIGPRRRDRYSPRPGRVDTGPRPLPDNRRRRR